MVRAAKVKWFSYSEIADLFASGQRLEEGTKIMAYTVKNYKSKKQMMEDFRKGEKVSVFQPGPFGPVVKDGAVALEGPHYPEPHKWYASAEVKDGIIVKVK